MADYLDDLKPGVRENAFYIKSEIIDEERIGIQSPRNKRFFIRVWNFEEKKHVGKFSKRNEYDILG